MADADTPAATRLGQERERERTLSGNSSKYLKTINNNVNVMCEESQSDSGRPEWC